MQLTSYDLMQLSEDYLESLSLGRLCNISKKLLADLKEARDRLNQNPSNSSVPPSSMPADGDFFVIKSSRRPEYFQVANYSVEALVDGASRDKLVKNQKPKMESEEIIDPPDK